MFEVLERCGLLRASCCPSSKSLPEALRGSAPGALRAAVPGRCSEAEIEALCERLRAPNEVRELALTRLPHAGSC